MGTIKLPGFGLPINEGGPSDRFPNAVMDWGATPITVRERTMMSMMNSITDKPEWDRKVFEDDIVSKWRQEALGTEDMDVTEKMLDWVIAELRDKADSYRKDGMISVYDLDAAVVKSDTAIPRQLAEDLKTACMPLENVPPRLKDWHPGSNGKVLDLVHPSLFPLMYGRSKVLPSGCVGLKDCVEFIGRGEVIGQPNDEEIKVNSSYASGYNGPYSRSNPRFWSKDYQWLPCQVKFGDDEEVFIASYINNLHPLEFADLSCVIEKCITRSIPLWNRTLSSTKIRKEPRIEMEATEYNYPQGREVPDDYMPEDIANIEDEYDRDNEREDRWKATRILIKPEPDEYDRLKISTDHPIDLKQQFKSSGLQVIVKLASIVLSPEKPEYEGGSWHIEGQLNERICASALYYYDSENITESSLAFRHRVDGELEMKSYDQDDYEGVEEVYGIEQDGPKVQEMGSVSTKQGRLIAFPNVFQHRVLPFSLQDRGKPGHRKILALFLVDPHTPILSTANIPPQQKAWWSEKLLEDNSLSKLPAELTDQVIGEVSGVPISLEEAKEIRLKLMEERKAFVDDVDKDFRGYSFSFCEH